VREQSLLNLHRSVIEELLTNELLDVLQDELSAGFLFGNSHSSVELF
jgi:hypothetical protein